MPTPLHKINSATPRPIQPSSSSPVRPETTLAASTAAVEITSLRLSMAVASSAAEPMRLPTFLLKAAIHSFTPMESSSTATVTRLNSTAVGDRILPMLERASSTPMTRIITETASPARYSMRAWP